MTAPTAEGVGLLPCPFCGGAARMNTATSAWGFMCRDCEAKGPLAQTAVRAGAAWNRRALSAVPDDGLGSSSPKSEDTHRAPDGWVLVPKEPSEAMNFAALAVIEQPSWDLPGVWTAMLQAAPIEAGLREKVADFAQYVSSQMHNLPRSATADAVNERALSILSALQSEGADK